MTAGALPAAAKLVIEHRLRFALLLTWNQTCAWCHQPLTLDQMHADHTFPRRPDSGQPTLADFMQFHGLPADFAVESLPNLAPLHSTCNLTKGRRVLLTQAISDTLHKAGERAPEVARKRAALDKAVKLERALIALDNVDLKALDEEGLKRARLAGRDLEYEAKRLLGFDYIWQVTDSSGTRSEIRTVTDGRRSGETGDHYSWLCPHCGQPGPWNGIKCLNCGQMTPHDID